MKTQIPPFYPIISFDLCKSHKEYSLELLRVNTEWIQLRNKGTLCDSEYLEFTSFLLNERNNISPGTQIIINDDATFCKKVGADGVHLGQSDGSIQAARELLGPKAIIGQSTNNETHVKAARADLLTYLACGPVFESKSKTGHAESIGLEGVKQLIDLINLPFVAIGGITLETAGEVFQAGASSIAMISESYKYIGNLEYLKASLDIYRKF